MKNKLTGRQFDVMEILWSSNKPLIASEIVSRDDSLNINTVQSVLKKLLEKKYVDVAEIVYSGTVLTRSYKPLVALNDYLQTSYSGFSNSFSSVAIMARLIETEKDERVIDELEELLERRKRELKGE